MSLRIYSECVAMGRSVGVFVRAIEKRDADLARQLRRCAASVVLNCAEGTYSTRGTQRVRFESALGSAAETRAALEVAEAFGYVDAIDAETRDRLDRIIATLWKLTR